MGEETCMHCQERQAHSCRGLCRRCYVTLTPAEKQSYPDRRHVANGDARNPWRDCHNRRGRLPASPTDALPGSEAKILVMQERVARGELPCHPRDARGYGGLR